MNYKGYSILVSFDANDCGYSYDILDVDGKTVKEVEKQVFWHEENAWIAASKVIDSILDRL